MKNEKLLEVTLKALQENTASDIVAKAFDLFDEYYENNIDEYWEETETIIDDKQWEDLENEINEDVNSLLKNNDIPIKLDIWTSDDIYVTGIHYTGLDKDLKAKIDNLTSLDEPRLTDEIDN